MKDSERSWFNLSWRFVSKYKILFYNSPFTSENWVKKPKISDRPKSGWYSFFRFLNLRSEISGAAGARDFSMEKYSTRIRSSYLSLTPGSDIKNQNLK